MILTFLWMRLYMFLARLLQRPGSESGGHFPRLLLKFCLQICRIFPKDKMLLVTWHTLPPPQRIMSIKPFLISCGIIDPEQCIFPKLLWSHCPVPFLPKRPLMLLVLFRGSPVLFKSLFRLCKTCPQALSFFEHASAFPVSESFLHTLYHGRLLWNTFSAFLPLRGLPYWNVLQTALFEDKALKYWKLWFYRLEGKNK